MTRNKSLKKTRFMCDVYDNGNNDHRLSALLDVIRLESEEVKPSANKVDATTQTVDVPDEVPLRVSCTTFVVPFSQFSVTVMMSKHFRSTFKVGSLNYVVHGISCSIPTEALLVVEYSPRTHSCLISVTVDGGFYSKLFTIVYENLEEWTNAVVTWKLNHL